MGKKKEAALETHNALQVSRNGGLAKKKKAKRRKGESNNKHFERAVTLIALPSSPLPSLPLTVVWFGASGNL
jgi:hypothetical protein